MCATADGVIRKTDGAMDIDGTIIPACALNSVPGDIPIIGDILVGDGLFGLTYALGGQSPIRTSRSIQYLRSRRAFSAAFLNMVRARRPGNDGYPSESELNA